MIIKLIISYCYSHLCFISCSFFCLIFNNVLCFLLSPYPTGTLSEHSSSFIWYSKLFLCCCWCTFLYCFFWLWLELLIFKYFVNSFICCFTHLLIVFLFNCLVLFQGHIYILGRIIWWENRFAVWLYLSLLRLGWSLGWSLHRFLLFLDFANLICTK